eukprot:594837-Rhodomonas_salina.3
MPTCVGLCAALNAHHLQCSGSSPRTAARSSRCVPCSCRCWSMCYGWIPWGARNPRGAQGFRQGAGTLYCSDKKEKSAFQNSVNVLATARLLHATSFQAELHCHTTPLVLLLCGGGGAGSSCLSNPRSHLLHANLI